ncbi:hypothetical protein [Amycolatopsis panacis]|uniref:hypothetical protein n=1 Tax=Amycolatopsis panacis TaxID=2340917 RepID=UPI0013144746|nr:hypothetical protein [Amycolatopsis panacis]
MPDETARGGTLLDEVAERGVPATVHLGRPIDIAAGFVRTAGDSARMVRQAAGRSPAR